MSVINLPSADSGHRIGLLGGSFDPPHSGHIDLSRLALEKLGLDSVWWLLTPHNPLKSHNPAKLETRLESCHELILRHRLPIKPTIVESGLASHYTVDTLSYILSDRLDLSYVWLMGSDNLSTFHHWRHWRKIASQVPLAIVSRPGNENFRSTYFAKIFSNCRLDESTAPKLLDSELPCWVYLSGLSNPASSTSRRMASQ